MIKLKYIIDTGWYGKDSNLEEDYVICPTTGKKLHPTTFLPIENHVDFINIKIL